MDQCSNAEDYEPGDQHVEEISSDQKHLPFARFPFEFLEIKPPMEIAHDLAQCTETRDRHGV